MAEPAPGWWKLTFLRRKKSQSKVFYEIPAEHASNTGHGNAAATATATAAAAAAMGQDVTTSSSSSSSLEASGVQDTELSARLERIVDKSASRGRHVKVSNSGRFKEKKRVRATLLENPEVFPGADGTRGESQRTGKGQQT